MNSEVLLLAEYNDIIKELIQKYRIDSVIKVIFISFIIKNNCIMYESTARKTGFIKYFFQYFNMNDYNKDDFKSILDVLIILEGQKFIEISDGTIFQLKSFPNQCFNNVVQSQMFSKIIDSIRKIGDESILWEVLTNV